MGTRALARLRKLALSFPEAHEVEAWGEPTFRVKNKIFAMHAAAATHHGEGREGVWVKALAVNQELLLRAAPDRFYKPPYVGPSGWIGVFLDGRDAPVDWGELKELLEDAWRMTAPKTLLKAVGEASAPAPPASKGRPRGKRAPKGN